jgi:transcriptional regulator with XRE-family HTH domain
MPKKPEVLVKFGQRLRTVRRDKGFASQEALADVCGLDRTYIGGIERGERNLSLVNVAKIAKALKMSISELTAGV